MREGAEMPGGRGGAEQRIIVVCIADEVEGAMAIPVDHLGRRKVIVWDRLQREHPKKEDCLQKNARVG